MDDRSAVIVVSESRKKRRWPKVFALVVAVLVVASAAAVGGAYVGGKHETSHWRPAYQRAVAERNRARASATFWKDSNGENAASKHEAAQRLADVQQRITRTVGSLDAPHFVLWNSCGKGPGGGCPIAPGKDYVGGVPDTFTYFVGFRSTVPVTVWIMDSSNFVCFETHACAWRGWGWQDQTTLLIGAFHDAEGCAGYLAVWTSKESGTLYPDVSVTRHPATHPTGACRGH
jgi:hypothetical protein